MNFCFLFLCHSLIRPPGTISSGRAYVLLVINMKQSDVCTARQSVMTDDTCDSILPRLHHWSSAALDCLQSGTEPFWLRLLVSVTVYLNTSFLHLRCLSSGHASRLPRLIFVLFHIPVRDHVQCLCSDSHFGHLNRSCYSVTFEPMRSLHVCSCRGLTYNSMIQCLLWYEMPESSGLWLYVLCSDITSVEEHPA